MGIEGGKEEEEARRVREKEPEGYNDAENNVVNSDRMRFVEYVCIFDPSKGKQKILHHSE